MKGKIYALLFTLLAVPSLARAQAPAPAAGGSMRAQLMPSTAAVSITTPTKDMAADKTIRPAMAGHRSGVPFMIAGAALFAAGLIADNDASTILILAGAGFGAYGLYLYFQ